MIATKLPKVGTTIFSVMSQLALEHKAVNLGQGFPDFEPPQGLRDALSRAMNEGRNQYAPMHGIAALREQITLKMVVPTLGSLVAIIIWPYKCP
jgi:methionine aminotransferase